jgi:hypothetical protein
VRPHPWSARARPPAQRSLAAAGSEMVMLRDTPSKCDRSLNAARAPFISESLNSLRSSIPIAVAVVLIAGAVWASTPATDGKLTVQRSTRAIPHKFLIRPSAPTVVANQTQRFEVTDAQGNPVAVHWNISGIGCSDATCGTIDEHGVFRTPPSITHPRIVTLEGVLATDSNYSVLTEVRLEATTEPIVEPAASTVVVAKPDALTAPTIGHTNITSRDELPPLSGAVAATPVIAGPLIERQRVAKNGSVPSLPKAIAPAPVIGGHLAVSEAALPPLPKVIPPAPEIRTQQVAGESHRLPLPKAVGPAPALNLQIIASTKAEPPLTRVIAPAPPIERRSVPSPTSLLPMQNGIAAAPEIPRENVLRDKSLLPTPDVISAAPTVQKQAITSDFAGLPAPSVIAAAPEIPRPSVHNNAPLLALPNGIAPAPRIPGQKTSSSAAMLALPGVAPGVGKQTPSSRVLLPMPSAIAGASDGAAPSRKRGPLVTYRDGQLTIDAENATLATVLQLVAEKTGAVIDVPPGTGLERIFEHTGPGHPNDVLTQLLNGSSFDFIIVNSPQRPQEPAEVLLSLRQPETPGPAPAAAPTVTTASSSLWTPPAEAPPSATIFIDNASLTPPKEPLSPDDLEKMMKERSRQIREQIQQQQPPQPQ